MSDHGPQSNKTRGDAHANRPGLQAASPSDKRCLQLATARASWPSSMAQHTAVTQCIPETRQSRSAKGLVTRSFANVFATVNPLLRQRCTYLFAPDAAAWNGTQTSKQLRSVSDMHTERRPRKTFTDPSNPRLHGSAPAKNPHNTPHSLLNPCVPGYASRSTLDARDRKGTPNRIRALTTTHAAQHRHISRELT